MLGFAMLSGTFSRHVHFVSSCEFILSLHFQNCCLFLTCLSAKSCKLQVILVYVNLFISGIKQDF